MFKRRSIGFILVLVAMFIGLTGIKAAEDPLEESDKKTPQEQAWEEFTKKFSSNEYIDSLKELGMENPKIQSTEDSLKITTTANGQTYTTNFTYEDGVIKYVAGSNEYEMFVDTIWINNCLNTIVEIKGYDSQKLQKWLDDNHKKLNIEKDGIQYSQKDVVYSEKSDLIEANVAHTIFTSFEMDIYNGMKTYTENNVVENPDTGVSNNLILVVLMAVLVVGVITYIKIKKYSKFPQA